ncbi:Uncharacterized protein ChrSV_2332 [Chromobacterium vaccinii]|nr:Uncharacterized protein ChrSW_2332 [Chromobacterium vaccinii]QND89789.1 Uncharacterized protein ChrSV_2332 [Chromobacterium vaccinii]
MDTHISTMRYAMEIATLSRILDEKNREIGMLKDTIAIQNEQLRTMAACAKELVDERAAAAALGIPRLAA